MGQDGVPGLSPKSSLPIGNVHLAKRVFGLVVRVRTPQKPIVSLQLLKGFRQGRLNAGRKTLIIPDNPGRKIGINDQGSRSKSASGSSSTFMVVGRRRKTVRILATVDNSNGE